MELQKNKTSEPQKDSVKKVVPHLDDEPKAHAYDRDKNKIYSPNDESVDEIVNDDGYRNVIHPNHDPRNRERS